MNIPKEAIEKAIEGGWKREDCHMQNGDYGSLMHEAVALDPSFWQSLGKALGWAELRGADRDDLLSFANGEILGFKAVALRFYDLVITGGDTDKFWRELLQ